MTRAVLVGDAGALRSAVGRALEQLEYRIVTDDAWDGADAVLLVTVSTSPPANAAGTGERLHRIQRAVARFHDAAADPARDATGEWRTQASVIHVVDHPVASATSRDAAFAEFADAMASLVRRSAVELAPRLRVNGLMPQRALGDRGQASQADRSAETPRIAARPAIVRPTLKYLATMSAITGQVLSLRSPRK